MSQPAKVNLSQPVPLIGAKQQVLQPKDRIEALIFMVLGLHEKVDRLSKKFEQIEVVALEGVPPNNASVPNPGGQRETPDLLPVL